MVSQLANGSIVISGEYHDNKPDTAHATWFNTSLLPKQMNTRPYYHVKVTTQIYQFNTKYTTISQVYK